MNHPRLTPRQIERIWSALREGTTTRELECIYRIGSKYMARIRRLTETEVSAWRRTPRMEKA